MLHDKAKKITISFLPNDYELWDYIQQKKEICNLSDYIRNLIKNDMVPHTSQYNENTIVEKILSELKSHNILAIESSESTNQETKDTILNLF